MSYLIGMIVICIGAGLGIYLEKKLEFISPLFYFLLGSCTTSVASIAASCV